MIAYDSIGGYMLQQGKCSEAEVFFENTLQYLIKNGAERLPISGMVYINAAKLYYLRNHLDKAEACALKSTRRVAAGPVAFEGYTLLAKIYLAKGQISKSGKCISEADKIARNDINPGYKKMLELVKLELDLYCSKVETAEKHIKMLGLYVEDEAIPKVSDRKISPVCKVLPE